MPKKILVVDDEAGIRNMAKLLLERKGYEVRTAENGQIALDKIKKQRPDLILADVIMPVMDGYTFYKELKNNHIFADIPVLIVTARSGMEDTFKVVGVDGFILKPIAPNELVEEIEHILKLSETRKKVSETPSFKKKVFAVGSNINVLQSMLAQSERAGYQVVTARTGAETLAKAPKFLPDILFIDLEINDMTSGELVDVLRRFPQLTVIPIIGYCYYSTDSLGEETVRNKILIFEETKTKLLKCGATEYIGRYNHQIFIKTITDYFEAQDEQSPRL